MASVVNIYYTSHIRYRAHFPHNRTYLNAKLLRSAFLENLNGGNCTCITHMKLYFKFKYKNQLF